MEIKKIISDLSFTSLILIIVTYSSQTLTIIYKPTFFYQHHTSKRKRCRFLSYLPNLHKSIVLSSSLLYVSSVFAQLFDQYFVLVVELFSCFLFERAVFTNLLQYIHLMLMI